VLLSARLKSSNLPDVLGDADELGDCEWLGDTEALGDVDADGLTDPLGLTEGEALGLKLGLRLGLADELGDTLELVDGDVEADGDCDALGDWLKLAAEIDAHTLVPLVVPVSEYVCTQNSYAPAVSAGHVNSALLLLSGLSTSGLNVCTPAGSVTYTRAYWPPSYTPNSMAP